MTAPANWHDAVCLEDLLNAIVTERPADQDEHLCLDKGYDNPTGRKTTTAFGYVPHIRAIRGETKSRSSRGRKARRWVVERTLAWLNKCRAILVRYDKHAHNFLGLIELACALLWYRRLWRLTRRCRF
jgi:putative transposase